MKSKFKGFTLVELIIVMAILVILMAAIMQMFKPIRETYVDSTLYENQRTTQNGIIKYISESTRYATDLGIYNKSTAQDAVNEFAKAYVDKNKTISEDDVKKNADVIVIDNATSYNGHIGRLLRREKDSFGNDTISDSDDFRIALGASYYGRNDYAIKVSRPAPNTDPTTGLQGDDLIRANNGDWPASYGIRITVASTAVSGIEQLEDESITNAAGEFNDKDFDPNEPTSADTTGAGLITVQGLVNCPNLVKTGGLFDVLDDTTRTAIDNAVQAAHGGGGGGGGIEVTPGSGSGEGNSSNLDGTTVNGVVSDDTVGDYNPAGGGGGGGGTPPPPPYSDGAKYDESLANKPGTKVYIVFLNN